jgi:hypothetical protein
MSKTAPGADLVDASLLTGMLLTVFVAAAIYVIRRWRGLGEVDDASWSPQQIATARHWRIILCIMLIAGWACLAVTLVHHALQHEAVALLPKTLGPVPIPDWFALAIQMRSSYRGLWYMLFASGMWFAAALDRRAGSPRAYKPVYAFICFLAAASMAADTLVL